MKLFGRNDSERPSGGSERRGSSEEPPVQHRLTLELTRAETFAAMLAKSRASSVIDVADLVAGMYICNWDRLSRYWREEDRDAIENYLQGICQISPQRWHSWIEFYDRERREGEPTRWRSLRNLLKHEPEQEPLHPSADLANLLKQAGEIAPSRDKVGERSIPILTSECVLLCIVRNLESEIGRKLAGTGLDETKLEHDARFPRRAPLGGGAG